MTAGTCQRCGIFRPKYLHRDHIIPKYAGGTDDPSNIQNLCANCHEDKTGEDRLMYGHPMNGRSWSPERREKIISSLRQLRPALKGRKRSAVARANISAAAKRRLLTPEGQTHLIKLGMLGRAKRWGHVAANN